MTERSYRRIKQVQRVYPKAKAELDDDPTKPRWRIVELGRVIARAMTERGAWRVAANNL